MVKGFRLFVLVVTAVTFGSGAMSTSAAETFFKGKTITIICPFSPGGTYDRMSRLTAQFMPKHIPGAPTIIVQNRTGGGGMIGARATYRAKPNGLTLLHMPSTYAFRGFLGEVKDIDFTKWGWLGSVGGAHYILFIRSKLPYRSIEDLRSASKPIKIGLLGKGSSITVTAKMLKRLGGLNLKLVRGYKGYADIALAIRQGEVDGVSTAAVTLVVNSLTKSMIEEGFTTMVVSLGGARAPEKFASIIGKLPKFRDYIGDEIGRQTFDAYMGTFNVTRPFMTTPGTPPERLAVLRDALWKMMHDPKFIGAAEQQGFVLHSVGHEEVGKIVKSMFELPKPVEEKLREIFK